MEIYEQPQKAYQKASWFCDLVLKNENGEPLRLSAGESAGAAVREQIEVLAKSCEKNAVLTRGATAKLTVYTNAYTNGFTLSDFKAIVSEIRNRDIDVMTINEFVDKYIYGITGTDAFIR